MADHKHSKPSTPTRVGGGKRKEPLVQTKGTALNTDDVKALYKYDEKQQNVWRDMKYEDKPSTKEYVTFSW